MTGDCLCCTVLLSDVAWTFDIWEGNPAEPSDKEVIVFKHPTPKEDNAIELEIEADIPELALLPDDNKSVSSSKSNNTSKTYWDLDDLVDNIVDYMAALKNHLELVNLIQTLTEVDTAIKKSL